MSDRLLLAVLLAGLVFQIVQYGFNRSFWLDETLLALNFRDIGYMDLLKPLDNAQSCPFLYLFAVKFSTSLFGMSELAFRLPAMVLGMGALVTFYFLVRRVIGRSTALIALALAAVNGEWIYYASELKPYSGDIMVAVGLYLLTWWVQQDKVLSVKRVILYGLAGSVAVWSSQSAAYVLGTVGLTLGVQRLWRRDWPSVAKLMIPASMWLVNFLIMYQVSAVYILKLSKERNLWKGSWLPFPPSSVGDVWSYAERFYMLFGDPVGPLGAHIPALAMGVFLVGVATLLRRGQATLLSWVILPIVLAYIGSFAHQYPLANRTLMFMLPGMLIGIAVGLRSLIRGTTLLPGALRYVPGVLIAGLVAGPFALSAVRHLTKSRSKEEFRPVLQYLTTHREAGDRIYVYKVSRFQYEFYAPEYGLPMGPAEVTWGVAHRRDREAHQAELEPLMGSSRVWVLVSHYSEGEALIYDWLDERGKRIDEYLGHKVHVVLYDLSAKSDATAPTPDATQGTQDGPTLAPAQVPIPAAP